MTLIDTVLHGDALQELRKLEDNSVDALVCDPPSSIHFMGKSWDSDKGGRKQWIEWLCSIMQEVFRVLKPGASGLVWALPRTSHWTATALEDAGFEIRDSIYHLYSKHDKLQAFMASLSDEQRVVFETLMEEEPIRLHIQGQGFPKSLDVSKQLDKLADAEREVIGPNIRLGDKKPYVTNVSPDAVYGGGLTKMQTKGNITAPATPDAKKWQGWHTALKPSVECWWLIRKPLSESSIAKNVMRWGTGAINIDGCRVGSDTSRGDRYNGKIPGSKGGMFFDGGTGKVWDVPAGRWPSHLLMTHSLLCNDEQCSEYCPVAILDKQSGYSKSTDRERHNNAHTPNAYSSFNNPRVTRGHNDQGGASRYFAQFQPDAPFIYASKASRKDRTSDGTVNNTHPTCKSQQLMRYMLRLVVPPNGVVLDCFAGSGSTLVAAISEDFHYIGIEQEQEYIDIINCRIQHALNEKNKEKTA